MNTNKQRIPRCQGSLQLDLAFAMGLVVIALLPLASSIQKERQLCKALYYRAVAMSIVDGEAEILQSGEWRRFEPGKHPYAVNAAAAKNLPDGQFTLNRSDEAIELTWKPSRAGHGGRVERRFPIPATP